MSLGISPKAGHVTVNVLICLGLIDFTGVGSSRRQQKI